MAFATEGDTVAVEVTGNDLEIASAVAAAGGTLGRGGRGLWLAHVPGDHLRALASRVGVDAVRVPQEFDRTQQSRARLDRGLMNAQAGQAIEQWHKKGYTGQGVRVGIIGLFDTAYLQGEAINGDLPEIPDRQRLCVSVGALCPFGTPGQTWGNSLAELLVDSAPDATLYLAELGTRTDYYAIIDWFAENGVTILVNPLLWTYDGPGNGTGPSAAIVDYAVSKGMTWFNLAGELGGTQYPTYGGSYWRGTWNDPDKDRWLNFSGTDESFSVYCGYLLGLRWNDWGLSPTDYDLYISDYNIATHGNGTKKLLSGNVQPAGGGYPLEGNAGVALCNSNAAYGPVYDTNKDGFVSLWVQRKSTSSSAGAVGDVLEIAVAYGWTEYWSKSGSAALAFADSANPGESTVGTQSITAGYSGLPTGSEGPTNDGRRKPDVTYSPCSTTSLDGIADGSTCSSGYFGSDGAAAVVAGFAAVAQQALGIHSPTAVVRYLRDNSDDPYTYSQTPQVDGGGYMRMSWSPPPTSYPSGTFVAWDTPTRLVDTRYGVGAPAALKAGQTLHVYMPPTQGAAPVPFARVLNVVLVNPTANGWLEAYPHGWSYSGRSSILNADAGHNRANVVVVPDDNGVIDIVTSGGGDIIVDYVGGFIQSPAEDAVGAGLGSGRFQPLEPFRLVDSRTCLGLAGCTGQPISGQTYTDITFAGAADPSDPTNMIPADATAVAFSLTVDTPAAKGYASVLPGGQSAITTSSLNFDPGGSATNLVLARVNQSGVARIFVSQTAHLQVDVLGWFTGPTGAADFNGTFVAVTPTRGLDTRMSGIKPPGGSAVPVDLTNVGVPVSAAAALINNVAVQSVATGELNVAATAAADPAAFRNLTYSTVGRPVAAATVTSLQAGALAITPSTDTHLVTDLWGYFRGPTTPPAPEGSIRLISHAPDGSPANAPSYFALKK